MRRMKHRLLAVIMALAACGEVKGDKPDATVEKDASGSGSIDSAIPFSPSQLTGLVMWLDADEGVVAPGGKVSGWADQSGQSNSAAQTMAARQPSVMTGILNGRAVIRFNGTSNVLVVPDAASLQWGTDDFTIAVVGSWTNPMTGYGAFLTKQADPYPYVGYSVWANFPQPSASTKFGFQLDAETDFLSTNTAALNDGMPRVFVSTRTGTKLDIRVGGTSDKVFTATTARNVTAVGAALYIGGHEQGASVIQTLAGDIAEVIAVRGTLSATDIGKLETYLKTKYAL